METTLHRQLKEMYCPPGCQQEVKFGRYRIDVVDGDRLIEIQHSGLAAIRGKIQNLVKSHKVDVVKPIIMRKRLIKLNRKNGKMVSQRLSPKKGGFLDLIDELIYFTRIFPHKNLRLITPWINVEELRYPGHGRRRRKREGDFVVQDRTLTEVVDIKTYETVVDLQQELPKLGEPFDTQSLADAMEIRRWQAQRVAYVLKHTGCLNAIGKNGN
ncbi:MAG: hypothetical protein AAGA30_05400 [Planctomycetota bacterium]